MKGFEEHNAKTLAVTTETYYNIMGTDAAVATASMRAKAFVLYSFYCVEALRQGSSQPLATDEFCSSCLKMDLKAIRAARKLLIDKGLIDHIIKKKRGFRYIRIHYLPIELPNRNLWELSTETPADFYGGDWQRQWLDRMLSNIPLLRKRIKKRTKQRDLSIKILRSPDEIITDMNNIFERVMNGYADLECERDFVFYLIDSFINEQVSRQRRAGLLRPSA